MPKDYDNRLILGAALCLFGLGVTACADRPSAAGDGEQTTVAEPALEGEQSDAATEQALVFESDDAVNEWILHYYKHPEPERTVGALRYLSESGRLDNAEQRRGMAFFFARVLEANDARADKWAQQVDDLPMLHRAFFAQALTLANTELCDAAVIGMADRSEDEQLAEGFRQMHKMPRVDPLDQPLEHPNQVGLIWAEFSATGDAACIEKLASVIHHVIDREDPEMMVVGVQASHELTQKAIEHPLVYETLERLAREATGSQQEALHNCIDDAGVILDQIEAANQATEAGSEESERE